MLEYHEDISSSGFYCIAQPYNDAHTEKLNLLMRDELMVRKLYASVQRNPGQLGICGGKKNKKTLIFLYIY